MGLNYLTAAEMVETTKRWLNEERATFESIVEITGLLPRIEEAHLGLVDVAAPGTDEDASTYPIVEATGVLDSRHDHRLRAMYYLLRAYREHLLGQTPVDPNAVQVVKDTQKAVFPHGMTGARVGYLEEAGNAKLAKESVEKTPGAKRILGEMRLTATLTGQHLLDQWADAAAALGARVQADRAELPTADPKLGYRVLMARHAWTGIVRTVLSVLEHSTAAPDKIAAIRGPVDAAEQIATRRAAEAQAKTKTE